MKLRSQIVFAQLPSVIVISLIAILFVLTLISIQNKASTILVDDLKSILAMQRLTESLEELENISLNQSSNLSRKKDLQYKIMQQLLIQEDNTKDISSKESLIQPLRNNWEKYKVLINSPSSKKADIEQAYKDLKSNVKSIIDLHVDELVRKKTNFSSFISNLLLFVALGPVFILIFSFFASWFLTGLLLNPLNKMAEIMRQVGTDGSTPLIHIKGSDEVEMLSEEFNQMTVRLDEYHRSSLGHVLRDYQMLKSAIDFIPNPVLLFNQKNDIIYSNQAAETILGVTENHNLSNAFINIEAQSQRTLSTIVNKVVSAKAAFIPDKSADAIIINNNNKKVFYLPFIYPLKKLSGNENNNISGLFIFLEDLTKQRSSDLSVTEVYETLVHEFQSPLSDVHMAIYTCAQELAGPLTDKQKEILFAAREKCEVLEKLTQDLLNLSKVNQTTLETSLENIDLVDVVINQISSLQLDTAEKGLFIEFQEPPYLKSLKANKTQIEILFGNLMRNAIEYAKPKSTVRIMLQEKKNFIEFSVNNEGALISPKHRKNIFKKYFKVPGQTTEGAGLGLYIAKQITDSMGAKIGFKSTDTRGTTFWIHFPMTESTPDVQKVT